MQDWKQYLPPNWVISHASSEDEALRLVGDVDVIVVGRMVGGGTSSEGRVSREIIMSARKLKMIQAPGSGVDEVDLEAAAERGVIVCNAIGIGDHPVAVAEHAMCLMLALAKNIVKYEKMLHSEDWRMLTAKLDSWRIPGTLLSRKTLGIVGLGNIGVEAAKRAKAFGMRIIAIKRHPSEELRLKLGIDFLGGPNDLPYILRESNFVVLSLVLTPETRKMVGERELRMMKRSAYLVNIGRGACIDEDALVRALKEGIIAGAGLDVFEIEPINPDSPLLKLENVVLTPHVSGGVLGLEKERAEFIVRNIEKVIEGQKPENIVDRTLKYAVK